MRHQSLRAAFAFTLLPLLGACASDEAPRIAAVLPLSGDGAGYGTAVQQGMTLAAEELARSQGAAAPVLVVADSGSDPARAAEELERLFDEGALAAVAGVTDREALAAAKVAERSHHVVLSPSAASPELSGISRWFFRVRPSGVHDGNRMALHAARELDLTRVAVLVPAGFPAGSANAFVAAFESQGGRVVARVAYDPAGPLAETTREVKESGAQAVYVDGPAPALGAAIAALRESAFRGRILTHSGFALPETLAAAGRQADGVLVSRPLFDPASEEPAVQRFVTAFEERYGREPGLFEAYGYDAVMTLGTAVATADGTTPEAVWKGLHGLGGYQGASGAIQFDERGDVRGFPRVYEVRRGHLAALGAPVAAQAATTRERRPPTRRIGG